MQDNNTKEIIKNKYILTLPYLNQERTQKFTSIVLTLLALSLFGFFAINPTVSTISRLQKELLDNQLVYDQLETKIKNLSALRLQYIGLQNDLPIVIDAIPFEPNVHFLFAQIQTAALRSNVSLKNLQSFEVEALANNTPTKQYYSYSFSMSGSGNIEDIQDFASTITDMQRIINIEIFAINNTSLQNVQSLDFDIQGIAFFKE